MIEPKNTKNEKRLGEIAWAFLRLGLVAFGGAVAHIALMEDEFVRRRGWLSREEFVDRVGAVNLLPGPSSTEMAIYLGHLRGGFPGLLIAGVAFILGALITARGTMMGAVVMMVLFLHAARMALGDSSGRTRCVRPSYAEAGLRGPPEPTSTVSTTGSIIG